MKVFYHDDLDGKCAAAIVRHWAKENTPESPILLPFDYDGIDINNIQTGEEVIIVDISFSKAQEPNLREVLNKAGKVTWIDHHQASFDMLKECPEHNAIKGIRCNDRSGAYLTWEYFIGSEHESEIPIAIRFVDDYDRWVFGYADTMNFKYGMDARGTDPHLNDYLWEDILFECPEYSNLAYIIKTGKSISNYLERKYEKDRERAYFSKWYGEDEILKCVVINGTGNSAVFGNFIEEYPFVVLWSFDGEYYKYSLYSHKDSKVDCNDICKRYGGGGHKHAAGFKSKNLMFPEIN